MNSCHHNEKRSVPFKVMVFSILAFLFVAMQITGCGSKVPGLEETPREFYEAWDKAVQLDKVKEVAAQNYASEYPEELNLATHPGLLTLDDFTGPIVQFKDPKGRNSAGWFHTPDMDSEEYKKQNLLQEGLSSKEYCSMKVFAEKYAPGVVSVEKLAVLQKKEIPVIYMLTECTGYNGFVLYDMGETYRRCFRNSFYRLDTGELVAWEAEPRYYVELNRMSIQNTSADYNNKRVFAKFEEGSGVLQPTVQMLTSD